MTRTEHLLTILSEEAAEVAQRVSKALRFGLEEVQPGQPLTNAQRIAYEMVDLIAVYQMVLGFSRIDLNSPAMAAKRVKVETYLRFSAGRGLVDGVPADPSVRHPEAKD